MVNYMLQYQGLLQEMDSKYYCKMKMVIASKRQQMLCIRKFFKTCKHVTAMLILFLQLFSFIRPYRCITIEFFYFFCITYIFTNAARVDDLETILSNNIILL